MDIFTLRSAQAYAENLVAGAISGVAATTVDEENNAITMNFNNGESVTLTIQTPQAKVDKAVNAYLPKYLAEHGITGGGDTVNVFKGINWCAIGDSYTWGDTANDRFTDSNGTDKLLTATTWLANEIGANLIQVGLGGAHLMPKVVDGEIDTSVLNYVTNDTWWYGMKNITSSTNIVTIQLGLNDNGEENYPIGEYGDDTIMTSYGAFKVLMDKIKSVCPLARIGLIVSDAWLSTTYATFLYDIADKYNLPILDLNVSSVGTIYGTGDTAYNYNFADSDVKNANNAAYRISSTNGHPNTESHKLRAQKLRKFLERLMM